MITLGSNSTLSLTIPSPGESNWATAIRNGCFQKIVDHNHQGLSGTGAKLLGYLALDLTTATLTNNVWFLARNAANSGNLKIFKIGSNNLDIYLGDDTVTATSTRLGSLVIKSDTYIKSANAASSGTISILKVNASDKVVLGDTNVSEIQGNALSITKLANITANNTAITLTDNQVSAIDTGVIIALTTDETIEIDYKLKRSTSTQKGTLTVDYNSGSITNEYVGTNVGVTFSLSSGLIKYTSTSTGTAPTIITTTRRI
ncbi:hypothetical protein M0R04_11520 [Candidatus Dojkabacteria bacterium]|jgi:hypothetical protein|nr:hypothetical protein [Candidatus Dojkabacteria bacterium]